MKQCILLHLKSFQKSRIEHVLHVLTDLTLDPLEAS